MHKNDDIATFMTKTRNDGTLMLKPNLADKVRGYFLTLKMVAISSRPSSFGSRVKACKTSPTGTVMKLTYVRNSTGRVHLENAVPV